MLLFFIVADTNIRDQEVQSRQQRRQVSAKQKVWGLTRYGLSGWSAQEDDRPLFQTSRSPFVDFALTLARLLAQSRPAFPRSVLIMEQNLPPLRVGHHFHDSALASNGIACKDTFSLAAHSSRKSMATAPYKVYPDRYHRTLALTSMCSLVWPCYLQCSLPLCALLVAPCHG